MAYSIDFSLATSEQIEAALCERLENVRLTRNITQAELSKAAGVTLRTIGRLEKGEGVSLNTFIRVLIALGIQGNLEILLPDPTIRPVERVRRSGTQRKRARPRKKKGETGTWAWGDETKKHK